MEFYKIKVYTIIGLNKYKASNNKQLVFESIMMLCTGSPHIVYCV